MIGMYLIFVFIKVYWRANEEYFLYLIIGIGMLFSFLSMEWLYQGLEEYKINNNNDY